MTGGASLHRQLVPVQELSRNKYVRISSGLIRVWNSVIHRDAKVPECLCFYLEGAVLPLFDFGVQVHSSLPLVEYLTDSSARAKQPRDTNVPKLRKNPVHASNELLAMSAVAIRQGDLFYISGVKKDALRL